MKKLLLLIFLFLSSITYSQVATKYSFTQTAETYTPITGGTVLWSGTFDDEVSDSITIPTFWYDGRPYTSIYISANGFITFGFAPIGTNYTPVSNTATYAGAISAFGRDVNQAASGTPEVRYQQIANEFIIQWQDVRRIDIANEIISFQIRLNTSDYSIRIVYGGTITPGSNTTYPQVGLRGPTNTFATNVNNRAILVGGGSWINSTAGTANSSTMYFNSATPTTVPSSGLTFTWTLSSNYGPYISYSTLFNTSNTGNRNLNGVIILDGEGTIASGALAPRVYWRVNTGSWTSAATSSGSSPYDFTISTTGLVIGDSVQYFVIAQDNSGTVISNPSAGLAATDVNNVTTPPTTPNTYKITEAAMAGDYTIGVALFRQLTGKNIEFEKRIRTVTRNRTVQQSEFEPENFESALPYYKIINGKVEEVEVKKYKTEDKNVFISETVTEEYYVSMLNGKEYKGSLYHEFTPEQISQYNLRGTGVYATITAAKNDLALRGVSGAVKLLLLDALYNTETLPISINKINGASAINSVTLQPNTGVVSTISGGINNAIILFNNCSYFIIEGRNNLGDTAKCLTVTNTTNGTSAHNISLDNSSTNNIIRYVITTSNSAATAGPRCIDFGTALAGNSSGNSNNLISFCELRGNRTGVGFAGTAGIPNNNNIIEDCLIYNQGFTGIWLSSNVSNTTIRRNKIFQTSVTATSANTGINIASTSAAGTNEISGNWIYDIQQSGSTTVYGISLTGGAGSTWNIFNNFFSLTLNNATKTAIYCLNISGANSINFNFYFNSLRVGGTHTGGTASNVVSCGLVYNNTSAGSVLNCKNNVSYNTRSGGTAGVFHVGNWIVGITGTISANYNTHFATGDANSFSAGWSTTVYNTIGGYQAAATPNEANTNFKATSFVSNTDLHIDPSSSSNGDLDLRGTPIAGITTDIDGSLRNEVYPYKGADEAPIPLPVELSSFSASVNRRDVNLNWATASELNNAGFDIERKSVSSEEWTKIGNVSGNGTTSEPKNYSFTDRGLNSGKYNYRLKQVDYNGNFEYFNLLNEVNVGVPEKYDLSQNYPNPFNPLTKINFDLPFDSKVTLKIYDITGREIKTLINDVQFAGYYTLQFDASTLSSGAYFYRITAEGGNQNFVMTKKMIVIK